jgi:hypothetical protein
MKLSLTLHRAILLSMLLLACQACNQVNATTWTTQPSLAAKTTRVPESTVTLTSPMTTAVLGEEQHNRAGRFGFRLVSGYTFESVGGMVTLLAPDGDAEAGPMITLIGGEALPGSTTQQLFDAISAQAGEIEIAEPHPASIGGLPALEAEISESSGEANLRGRLITLLVAPGWQFMALGIAPAERWENELAPLFTAVTESVVFFMPTTTATPFPSASTPTPPDPTTTSFAPLPNSPTPLSIRNIQNLPVFPTAENVTRDDYTLAFSITGGDRLVVRDFYLAELPRLGWQLDMDADGNCIDKNRCMAKLMDLHYTSPNNVQWFFIDRDGLLSLLITEQDGVIYVSLSLV